MYLAGPKGTVYISGPMTGLPDLNFPAFRAAAGWWRTSGWKVINPAEMDGGDISQPKKYYMRRDIATLLRGDITAIALLPGWQNSRGAVTEAMIARELDLKCFLPIFRTPPFSFVHMKWEYVKLPLAVSPLAPTHKQAEVPEWEEAINLVAGDRQSAYGHPWEDFSRTAQMVSGLLRAKLHDNLTPEDVAMIMMCVKMSREQNAPKRDNVVDLLGYGITLAKVKQRRKEIYGCGSSSSSPPKSSSTSMATPAPATASTATMSSSGLESLSTLCPSSRPMGSGHPPMDPTVGGQSTETR